MFDNIVSSFFLNKKNIDLPGYNRVNFQVILLKLGQNQVQKSTRYMSNNLHNYKLLS
jgi:hypothetical protein